MLYVLAAMRKELMHRPASRGYQKDPLACVYPRILVGAGCQLTRELAEPENITHVINCAEHADCPSWWPDEHPLEYAVMWAVDHPTVKILHWYPKFRDTLTQFLREPGSRNIYIHCQCGINRSAFLMLAYVIDCFGLPFAETSRAIVEQRPCALTNPAFWYQVKEFAKSRASKHGGVSQ